MGDYRLEVKNLHKRFPGVYAVKGVSFQIAPGEVHALVGENGAGKSTLMKMITGEYIPDEGEVYHNGELIKAKSVADSQKNGIAMIHQELAPLPDMTIAENIFLGQEIMKGKFLNDREMERQTAEILKEYGMDFDPRMKVRKLSVAQTQMLEIIKAVRKNADVIIMDEPTSSLADEESKKLFEIIRELKEKDVAIIYISHRLEEILMITDRITVLRDGEYIKTVPADGVTQNELIEMMVGRTLDNIYPKEEVPMGETVFEVKNLCREGVFEDVSFSVKAGEILGFSGLVGAGRSEIMNAIFGLDKLDAGQIFVDGREVSIKNPTNAIENKIAMVSEDRKLYGLVLCRSIKENISLPNLSSHHRGLFINRRKEMKEVQDYEAALGIKCASIQVDTGTLSGGNQQKVVLAKWLLSEPRVLILDEPTRGIDVGAKFEIYKMMVDLAKKGIAIIMISSELPEVMGMSDRILCVSGGKITGEFERKDIISGRVTQKSLLNSALKEV
ncbi:MAG: sugar ABC transporter ATP-binding protein [Eubacteriales bacterium]|nr:sugar ABC transporter ATP-binding protein [Eubacteriales bacterium]